MVVKSFDSGISALLPFESASHHLLLEWSLSQVHIMLWNDVAKQLVAIESFAGALLHEDAWDELYAHSRLIQYRDVPVLFCNAGMRAMPVPQSLFDAERAAKELNIIFGEQPFQANTANHIPAMEMVWLHQVPQAVKAWIERHFNQVSVVHTIGQWLGLHGLAQHGPAGKVLVYESYAWVMLFANNSLVYAWSVPIHTADDLAYRLLNVCRQQGIDASEVEWQVGGMIEKDAPLYQGLSKFLENIDGWPLPEQEMNNQVPAHYIAHLFQLLS